MGKLCFIKKNFKFFLAFSIISEYIWLMNWTSQSNYRKITIDIKKNNADTNTVEISVADEILYRKQVFSYSHYYLL